MWKSFGVAVLITVVLGQQTLYQEKLNAVSWTYTTPKVYNLFSTATGMNWDLIVSTRFNEDSGAQVLRLQHRLQAPIMATDKVLFEIAFKVGSIQTTTTTTQIAFDVSRCQMQINSNDQRFWVPTTTDGYYTLAQSLLAAQEPQTELAQANNWVVPFQDTDPLNRWCTPANSMTQYSEFQCTQLSCYMERAMNTGDAVQDLKFTVDSKGTTDQMIIEIGRAQLWFNKSSFAVSMKVPSTASLSIPIYGAQATSLSIAAATILTTYLLMF